MLGSRCQAVLHRLRIFSRLCIYSLTTRQYTTYLTAAIPDVIEILGRHQAQAPRTKIRSMQFVLHSLEDEVNGEALTARNGWKNLLSRGRLFLSNVFRRLVIIYGDDVEVRRPNHTSPYLPLLKYRDSLLRLHRLPASLPTYEVPTGGLHPISRVHSRDHILWSVNIRPEIVPVGYPC